MQNDKNSRERERDLFSLPVAYMQLFFSAVHIYAQILVKRAVTKISKELSASSKYHLFAWNSRQRNTRVNFTTYDVLLAIHLRTYVILTWQTETINFISKSSIHDNNKKYNNRLNSLIHTLSITLSQYPHNIMSVELMTR